MTLSELIATIGDDSVRFQSLDQCASNLNWTRKSGSKITFHTEEPITPGEGTVKLGLVLWFDREAVAAVLAKEKGAVAEASRLRDDAARLAPVTLVGV